MGRACNQNGGRLECFQNLNIGKRPLGRPRSRWEDNIIMDLKEIAINMRNWVDSVLDMDYWRAIVSALNLRVS